MHDVMFSIVIPTYNRAEVVNNCIYNIYKQEYTNWEAIIVDDGSNDNTKEIVSKHLSKDSRIKYIYQENQERSVARNNGISHANGDYIICLDSDDLFNNNHLNGLNEFIKSLKNKEVMIINHFQYLRNNQLEPGMFPDFSENIIDYFFRHPVIPARVCAHKSIFDEFKYTPEITIVEDSILWSEISTKYPIVRNDQASVIYHLHDDNSVNVKNYSAIKRLHGLKIFFKSKTSNALSNTRKKELISDCHYRIALSHIYHCKKGKARIEFIRSIVTNPIHKRTKTNLFELLMTFRQLKNIWDIIK